MIEFSPKRNMERAACYGADPDLFNALTFETAGDALSYCDRCPVIKECDEWVKPRRSYYDGVASGRVWHNGVALKPTLF
jgi:WhiB family redox-sensing transcriptional regulator